MEDYKNWDYQHFITYVYIAIANADYDISEDEINLLHEKLDPIISDNEGNFKGNYDEVLKVYNSHNDNSVYNFISEISKKFITNEQQKEQVLKDIQEIIAADGHEFSTEKIMFMAINKLLNTAI